MTRYWPPTESIHGTHPRTIPACRTKPAKRWSALLNDSPETSAEPTPAPQSQRGVPDNREGVANSDKQDEYPHLQEEKIQ